MTYKKKQLSNYLSVKLFHTKIENKIVHSLTQKNRDESDRIFLFITQILYRPYHNI